MFLFRTWGGLLFNHCVLSSLGHATLLLVSAPCLPSCDGSCIGLSSCHCPAVCCSPLAEVLCGGLPPSYSSTIRWCCIGYSSNIGKGIYLAVLSLHFSVSMPLSYGSGRSACHRLFVGFFCLGRCVLLARFRSICKSLGLLPRLSPTFCSISFWYSSSHFLFCGHRLQLSAYFIHNSISRISTTQTKRATE